MLPAIRDGAVLYADPGRPVRIGDDVLVELARDAAATVFLVRRLTAMDADTYTLEQYSPSQACVIYPAGEVRQIVHILTINELMGVT